MNGRAARSRSTAVIAPPRDPTAYRGRGRIVGAVVYAIAPTRSAARSTRRAVERVEFTDPRYLLE
jgi:hypothetical protein